MLPSTAREGLTRSTFEVGARRRHARVRANAIAPDAFITHQALSVYGFTGVQSISRETLSVGT